LTLGKVALISLTLLDKRSINYNLIHLTLGKVVLISLTLLEKRSINYNLILMINTSKYVYMKINLIIKMKILNNFKF
jgi:hypothetical protein